MKRWITCEIAGILDCSESALKSLLFRAYETLRVQLAPLVTQPVQQRARGRKAIMKCEEVSKELIAYLERRANSAERREVEEHLAGCAACRTRAEEFRALWSVLDEVPAIEPSFGFDARVRQRVAAEPQPELVWVVRAASRGLALSAALLVALTRVGGEIAAEQ